MRQRQSHREQQSIDRERWPRLVLAFLRVALGEGEGLRALELAAQRFILALRRLNDLVVQRVHLVLQLAQSRLHRAFERDALAALLPQAEPSRNAFGKSGEVKVRIALPGEPVEYPLQIEGDPTGLTYTWMRVGDSLAAGAPKPMCIEPGRI